MRTVAAALILIAHLSYYNPALCGVSPINCFNPQTWWHMSAGTDARHWFGRALACPQEFALGSHWTLPSIRSNGGGIPSQSWVCLDRGGMVITRVAGDGTITVILDLLYQHPIVSNTVKVEYRGPLPHALLARVERMRESCSGKVRC